MSTARTKLGRSIRGWPLCSMTAQMLAAEPDPPLGAIRYLLAGLGLKALGQSSDAQPALEHALEIEPKNELARSALRELQ